MYKILKKRVRTNAIIGFIGCILIIILISFLMEVNIKYAISSFGFAQKIATDKKLSDYEGKYVKHTVKYPLEIYSESYSNNNSTTPQSISYIVWDDERNEYIGIEVVGTKKHQMEKLIDQAWSHLVNEDSTDVQESIKVKGVVKKMSDQQLDSYKQTMNYIFGEQASDQIIDGWYIDNSSYGQSQHFTSNLFTVSALFFLLVGLGILITGIGPIYCILLKKFISRHDSVTEQELENNFMTAAEFGFKLWIGEKYSIFLNSFGLANAILNDDLIWAYLESKNNAPLRCLHLYTREKEHYKINLPEKDGLRAMYHIKQKMPFVMNVYDKELLNLFKKDFNKFLYKSGLR